MKAMNLGDKVKDPITGYWGIAYCRITYLQGCDRIGIQAPMVQEKGKLPEVSELYYVDEPQLEIISKGKKKKSKVDLLGGPSGFGLLHKNGVICQKNQKRS